MAAGKAEASNQKIRAPKVSSYIAGEQVGRWIIVSLFTQRVQKGAGWYHLCECRTCGLKAEISEGTLQRNRAQCWKCTLREARTSTKPVCPLGHEIETWGRTPTGACRGCVKHKSLLRSYGITLLDYIALYNKQDGKCAVCGRELGPYIPEQQGYFRGCRIEVDHDHNKTGKESVRGLLCGGRWAGCNRKLGRIDKIEWLERVLAYLKNSPAQRLFSLTSE